MIKIGERQSLFTKLFRTSEFRKWARKLLKQKVAKGSIQKGLAQKMRIHGEAGCGAGKEKPGQTFPALIQNKVQAPPSSPRHKNEN